MLDNVSRYDMQKAPMRQHLGGLIWLLSSFALIRHRARITKTDMDGIRPPYLLLCNHNAFMDFMAASHAIFPHRANFVVAIDGFIGREWLLRLIGCICTRKFTMDLQLVRNLVKVIRNGDIAVIYPEARYSLCGTTAVLPDSLGKLAKLLNVPVVTLLCHGHHVNSPFYHLPDHGVRPTTAELKLLLDKDQVDALSAAEINARIRETFVYDDFRWQQENHIRIRYRRRAEGLHKVPYQCPVCLTEYRMGSAGTILKCAACGSAWELDEYGKLSLLPMKENGDAERPSAGSAGNFTHVPDWYEWERENVRREVRSGTYRFESPVRVRALPNARAFIDLGPGGTLVHDMNGFHLSGTACGTEGTGPRYAGEEYRVDIKPSSIYSCHIEYEYLGKFGDCIDLNTAQDTLYIYPLKELFSVTKIALATEELYAWDRAQRSGG